MKFKTISEGAVKLKIPIAKRIYDADVFYNPVMVLNRDISILIAKVFGFESAVDLLSATGIRALRLKKEAGVKEVFANDANPYAVKLIKANAKLNRLKVNITKLKANEFFCKTSQGFDYIDVDPFGTPVPFLDLAMRAVKKGGMIGVTATDTAALCGAAPSACLRKYGAKPLHDEIMHEVGIRILLKKIVEAGAQYDIALTPIFCHSTEHYMRVYLQADRGADKTNSVLRQIGFYKNAGPMWLGRLWDEKLCEKIYSFAINNKFISVETKKLLHLIKEESKINSFGYFDIATMSLKQVPKISGVINNLKAKGFLASRTHFSPTGIRTNAKKIF